MGFLPKKGYIFIYLDVKKDPCNAFLNSYCLEFMLMWKLTSYLSYNSLQ